MKLFTLDEAEALLPQLREELAAMQATKTDLDSLRECWRMSSRPRSATGM